MSCDDILLSLMALRDGESTLVPSEEVEAHLRVCPGCLAEAMADTALRERWESIAPAPVPPPEVWAGLRPRLRRKKVGLLIATALAVLLLRTGILLQLPSGAWAGSAVAVLWVALGFALCRENPLRIHARCD